MRIVEQVFSFPCQYQHQQQHPSPRPPPLPPTSLVVRTCIYFCHEQALQKPPHVRRRALDVKMAKGNCWRTSMVGVSRAQRFSASLAHAWQHVKRPSRHLHLGGEVRGSIPRSPQRVVSLAGPDLSSQTIYLPIPIMGWTNKKKINPWLTRVQSAPYRRLSLS